MCVCVYVCVYYVCTTTTTTIIDSHDEFNNPHYITSLTRLRFKLGTPNIFPLH